LAKQELDDVSAAFAAGIDYAGDPPFNSLGRIPLVQQELELNAAVGVSIY
jgi:hypothetical protein